MVMRTITIKDIAEKCGVGVSTVSRAINNHPDINPETKNMIMQTIAAYNYVPNNSARNLKRTVSKTIAILVKAIDNSFFAEMIQIMEREINIGKYSYFLQHIDEDQDEFEVAIELIKEKRLKGIVFLGGYADRTEEMLKRITVPFVMSTVGNTKFPSDVLCSYMAVDDKKESYKVTDYLCKLGHSRIAILAALKNDEGIGRQRLEGYKKALKDNGVEIDDELICYMKEDIQTFSTENGYVIMKELLDSGKEFTAVYAISDMMAIGACKAIFEAGKKLPEDYSIAGFDGLGYTYYYEPSITTLKQPVKEIAEESIHALFYMIEKKKPVPGRVFEGILLERESTRSIKDNN